MEPTKDDEVKPTKGGEGEPTKGGEVEPTNDGEMEPATASEVGDPATAIAMAAKPRLRTPTRGPRRMPAPPTFAPPAHLLIQMPPPLTTASTPLIIRDLVRERDLAREA